MSEGVYKISNSEISIKRGSDYETKSLLYLYARHKKKNIFYYYFIDLFNDVTATSKDFTIMADLQSKGHKQITPKELGKRMVTLFKNYVSNFKFDDFLLVISGNLADNNLKDNIEFDDVININDYVNEKCKEKIIKGLYEAIINSQGLKDYCFKKNNEQIIKDIIDFLFLLKLVIANKENYKYIESILGKEYYDESFLESIFNDIREKQLSKKSEGVIEGVELSQPCEAIKLNRHFEYKDLQLLIMNRIIANDYLVNSISIPYSFMYFASKVYSEVEIKELSSLCRDNIRIAVCNKNNRKVFWNSFQTLFDYIRKNLGYDIETLHKGVNKEALYNILLLQDYNTEIFLLAMIKEGVENYDICQKSSHRES